MTEPSPEIPLKVTVTSPRPPVAKPGVVRKSGSTRRHLIGMGVVVGGGGLVAAASTGVLVPVAVGVGAVGVAGAAVVLGVRRSTGRRRAVGTTAGNGNSVRRRFGTRSRAARWMSAATHRRRHRMSTPVGAGHSRAQRQRSAQVPGRAAATRRAVAGWSTGRRAVDRHALRAHGAVGRVTASRTRAGRAVDRAAAPVKRAVGTRWPVSASGSTAVGRRRQGSTAAPTTGSTTVGRHRQPATAGSRPVGSREQRRRRKSLARRAWDWEVPVSFASTGVHDRRDTAADDDAMYDSAIEPAYDGPAGPGVRETWNKAAGKVGDHVRLGWASPLVQAWGVPFQGLFTKKKAADAAPTTQPEVSTPANSAPAPAAPAADKKPMSWTATPEPTVTEGHTMFGFDTAVDRLSSWSADNPDEMRNTLKVFPEELGDLASGIRAMARSLEEEHPFGQSVPEAYHQVANMIDAAAGLAGEAPAAFEKENEKDLDRHDAPRPGEQKWNV